MFEQAFKNIDDVLWKEAGCTTELDYTEQTSWLLFLNTLMILNRTRAPRRRWKARNTPTSSTSPIDGKLGRAQGQGTATRPQQGLDRRRSPRLRERESSFRICIALSRKRAARTPSNTRLGKYSARSRTRFKAATTCARLSITLTSCAFAHRPRSTNSRTFTSQDQGIWETPGATAASITLRVRSSVPLFRS